MELSCIFKTLWLEHKLWPCIFLALAFSVSLDNELAYFSHFFWLILKIFFLSIFLLGQPAVDFIKPPRNFSLLCNSISTWIFLFHILSLVETVGSRVLLGGTSQVSLSLVLLVWTSWAAGSCNWKTHWATFFHLEFWPSSWLSSLSSSTLFSVRAYFSLRTFGYSLKPW